MKFLIMSVCLTQSFIWASIRPRMYKSADEINYAHNFELLFYVTYLNTRF